LIFARSREYVITRYDSRSKGTRSMPWAMRMLGDDEVCRRDARDDVVHDAAISATRMICS